MTFISKLCIFLGLLFLAHAGYSAYEYSTFFSRTHSASSSSSYSVPLDIRIETIVSVFLICFGLVSGANSLKPIDWNVWAGKIEKEGGARNPFRGLEERAGFLDIRAKRKEFAEWINSTDAWAISSSSSKRLLAHLEKVDSSPVGQYSDEQIQQRTPRQLADNSTSKHSAPRNIDGSFEVLARGEPADSSYALPPLPALQTLDRSPPSTLISAPQRHQRSSSSIYYAAAWGSPYATPSPKRSAERENSSSKLASSRQKPGYDRSERGNWLSDDSAGSQTSHRPSGTKRNHGRSWLDLYSDDDSAALTPTLKSSAASHKSTQFENDLAPTFQRLHRGHNSVDTVKQEDIDMAAKSGDSHRPEIEAGSFEHGTQNLMDRVHPPTRHASEKSAQQSPSTEMASPSRSDPVDGSPRLKRQSSTTSGATSQRSKKRVIWKGKACLIALPSDDERGKRPLLTSTDLASRLQQWQREGWDIRGFKLTRHRADEDFGRQTCSPFPDPEDVLKEREHGQFRVNVPNQAEWEAYVTFLKEEKLRALGVTSSDSDHPQPTCSGFPPSVSRASSRLPGQSLTPPIPSSSTASNMPPANGFAFSPAMCASNTSSRVGSAASLPPHFVSCQNGMHHSDKSMAYLALNSRITSPLSLNPLHPTPRPQRGLSPSAYTSQRSDRYSPPSSASLQSLGQVLSPISPFAMETHGSQSQAFFPNKGQQHEPKSDFERGPRHQPTHTETGDFNSFPSSFTRAGDGREIVHPAPQGHQRNISEALQREIDEAEEAIRAEELTAQQHSVAVPITVIKATHDSEPLALLYKQTQNRDISDPEHREQPSKHPTTGQQPGTGETALPQANYAVIGSIENPSVANATRDSQQVLLPQRAIRLLDHKLTSSMSKLNVEAEEFKFNPRNQFSNHNFVFVGDAFQPQVAAVTPFSGASGLPEAVLPTSTVVTGLKPDAPSFTPSTLARGDCQFNSAAFNVDAPVFNPGVMGSKSMLEQTNNTVARDGADRIFSNVAVDTTVKAMRRGKVSRALPIQEPDVGEHTEDDEDGRVKVSTARQKRARIQRDDSDDIPQYAAETPLRNDELHFPSSDTTSTSLQPIIGVDDDAEQTPPDGTPDIAVVAKGDQQFPVTDDTSAEPVHLPSAVQGLPSQPGLEIARDEEKDTLTRPPPNKQSFTQDTPADVEEARKYSSGPHSAASLSASPLSNAVDETLCDPISLTIIIPDAVGLEGSHYVASPPSSPPATTMRNEPLPQHVLSENSPAAPSSHPAEAVEMDPDRASLHDERADDPAEVVPEFRSDDIEHSAPPSEMFSPSSPDLAERDGTVPSYHEIDAVMKQLEDNPELGVERLESPLVLSRPSGGLFLNPSINIRSDVPSPSPRQNQTRLEPAYKPTEMRMTLHQSESSIETEPCGLSIDGTGGADISDWNETLSVADEGKFGTRTPFFDTHVNSLVGNILEERLGPVERTLETIRHSVALLANQSQRSRRRTSTSDDNKYSDADDEDEDTRSGNLVIPRPRASPSQKKDLRSDTVKAAVMEALTTYKQESLPSADVDQAAFEQLLSEVRSLKDSMRSNQNPEEIKAVVEEVISTHPRLRGKRVQEDHQAGASQKFGLQIDGLESMLKVANERAEEEYRARRKVEDDLAETERQLNLIAEEAAQYREASEEAEHSLRTYYEEKESMQALEQSNSDLLLKSAALETTLEEYRLSHDQWRIDMDDERDRNRDLKAVLQSLRREIEETSQTKHSLHARLDRLQDDMADVMERVAHDQATSIRKEHELSAKNKEVEAELYREIRMRQKMELEFDELERGYKEVSKFRDAYEVSQKENARLEALVVQIRKEARNHEDAAHKFAREVDDLRNSTEAEASRARSTHEHDIDMLKGQHDLVRADLEGQISRLQAQLQHARDETEDMRSKHQAHLDDHVDRSGRELHEVNEIKEAALADQRRTHENALNDLRGRHARALHNASDDKHRLEAHFTEKLALSSEKVQHLEGKVVDLQERLEVATSAARAAAAAAVGEAATVLETDSMPQSTAASITLARGTGIPEKISPQALRESIMVLQDQLQNREQTIESLEAELAQVDKDAPTKIKDRETEISWLRELLGVRIDDLEEIINVLSEPEYNRDAVKDAVIRLKANLQMEQQEKERAAQSIPGGFPSIASLSSLTQTPRALPMAAAAAWGNWRKGRDTSLGNLSDFANTNNQTPSRSSSSSQSFLSSLLTPPRTNQRQATPPLTSAPPTITALNGRRSSSEARPLRSYNSQVRSMSVRQAEKGPLKARQSSEHDQSRNQNTKQVPSTPPLMRDSSYDRDADARRSIMSDVDDDASPVGSVVEGGGSSLGEPFEESTQ